MKVSVSTYPWAFDIPGGGERQLQNYCAALERGLRKWPELNVSRFDMWSPEFRRTQLMHYFGCMPSSLDFLSHVKSIRGIPLVISPNFWPDPEGWDKAGVLDKIKSILWLADIIIVNSFIEEEALVRLMHIDSKFIAVVPNAVDDAFFEPVSAADFRREFNIEGPYVLNVANVEPRKNQLAFLKALKSFPDLTLVTIGAPREAWYMDACIAQGGKQFRLVNALPPGSTLLRSAMAGCEFFAMPSLVETPSIASLEAAATGARILSTELGSPREYFGDLATYVNPYDIAALSCGIAQVRCAVVDVALAQRVRSLYTWDIVVEALVKAYGRATGKNLLKS